MTMTLNDLFNYSNQYTASYKVMDDARGRINFKEKHIWVNPVFADEGLTYAHEMFHHHYDKELGIEMPESEIERLAKEFYDEHELACEKLAFIKLNPGTRYAEIKELD